MCARTGSLFPYKVRGTNLRPILNNSHFMPCVFRKFARAHVPFEVPRSLASGPGAPNHVGKLHALHMRVAYICGHVLVNLILNPRSSKRLFICAFSSCKIRKQCCTAVLLHTLLTIVWKRGL